MGQNHAPEATASFECNPNSTARSFNCSVSGGWPGDLSMPLVAGVADVLAIVGVVVGVVNVV
jgi:hypothetical protein